MNAKELDKIFDRGEDIAPNLNRSAAKRPGNQQQRLSVDLPELKKVLFVCIENSCRSQMAEAFAKIHGKGVMEPYSAGSRASGKVNEKAIKSMREAGYDLGTHISKSLNDIPGIEYDFAITMGCGDECPRVKAKQRDDWAVPDPKNMDDHEFNKIRDLIERRVISLISTIQRNLNEC